MLSKNYSFVKFVPGNVNFRFAHRVSLFKSSMLLKKLLDKESKKSKKNPTMINYALEVFPNSNEKVNRKLAAINKVYMQNLNEVIQTEKYSSQLSELGIELTKVNISKDRAYMNVYWLSKNDNLNESEVQKVLKKAGGEMQREIGLLRYIGKVPQIRFVRDVFLENQIRVERLLTLIDLGKNYEPSKPQKAFQKSFGAEDGENLPKMTHNVLGLNHDKIKERILADIKRFKVIELPEKEFDFKEVDLENLIPFDKKTFAKFYQRRQILKRKMEKNMNYHNSEGDDEINDGENEFFNDDYDNEQFKEEFKYEDNDFYKDGDKF